MSEPILFNTLRKAVMRYNDKSTTDKYYCTTLKGVLTVGIDDTPVAIAEPVKEADAAPLPVVGAVELRPTKFEFVAYLATMKTADKFLLPKELYWKRYDQFREWAAEAAKELDRIFATEELEAGLEVRAMPKLQELFPEAKEKK